MAPDKPVFFLMGNIHGRELITNELAMVFLEYLLTRYGVDADVTWLLDHHHIAVLVSANPDGHVKNELGQPWAYWRKNTHPYGTGCSQYGVDLNRNSGYRWGGASDDPCHILYQGPEAVSEPETQAVQALMRRLFPDRRPDDATTPAPDDTMGVFITLHSYSDLVLWPWGHTYTPAPNDDQLAMLGTKLATYNDYDPKQASDLYPATGTTDDWAYGELGIASYTFEIGDTFYPSCERYDALIQPNLDALLYAAKVARTPYITAIGPDTLDVTAKKQVVDVGEPLTITARIDDFNNVGSLIIAAEAYVGIPSWEDGPAYAMLPVDGSFNTSEELTWISVLPTVTVTRETLVYVRGRDQEGIWGPPTAAYVEIDYDAQLVATSIPGPGIPDTIVSHTLTLTNTGTLSQSFTLSTTGASWTTTLVPTRTILMPGAAALVTVAVTLPPRDAIAPADLVTLTVRSLEVPALVRSAVLETRALWSRVSLPLVLRDG
jgi:hypothetical protein